MFVAINSRQRIKNRYIFLCLTVSKQSRWPSYNQCGINGIVETIHEALLLNIISSAKPREVCQHQLLRFIIRYICIDTTILDCET